jgi:hypothetical protein
MHASLSHFNSSTGKERIGVLERKACSFGDLVQYLTATASHNVHKRVTTFPPSLSCPPLFISPSPPFDNPLSKVSSLSSLEESSESAIAA